MNKPALASRFGGALGREFAELRSAIRSLWPVSGEGVRVNHTTEGVSIAARDTGASALNLALCRVVFEGGDAVRCLTQAGASIVVAKPFQIASNYQYGFSGLPFHSRGFTDATMFDSHSIDLYTDGVDPLLQEWQRILILSGTPYDGASPQSVVQVIDPPYTFMQANQTIPAGTEDILAVKCPFNVTTVDPVTLTFDGAGDAVQWLDLNVAARRWVKRTEAINSEATIEFAGIPTWLVREP